MNLKLPWTLWAALIALLLMLLCILLNLYALNALLSKEVQLRLDLIKRINARP